MKKIEKKKNYRQKEKTNNKVCDELNSF